MITVTLDIGTTWTASTSYIPIPDEYPAIESIPTTQVLEGAGIVAPAFVRKSKEHGVQITSTAVKHNLLHLHYSEISVLSRYAGLAERP